MIVSVLLVGVLEVLQQLIKSKINTRCSVISDLLKKINTFDELSYTQGK